MVVKLEKEMGWILCYVFLALTLTLTLTTLCNSFLKPMPISLALPPVSSSASVFPPLLADASSSLVPVQQWWQRFRRTVNPDHPGSASIRGRRYYQEDRLLCAPRLRISVGNWTLSQNVGLFGVFDGHLGDSASAFAAASITERFLYLAGRSGKAPYFPSRLGILPWLEASLRQVITDIDVSFGKNASAMGVKSGSTAAVALHVVDRLLVANVGDSKALLCSSCKKLLSDRDMDVGGNGLTLRRTRHKIARGAHNNQNFEGLCVQELSRDHHPDRPDERSRIESLGGFVTMGSYPRVNGRLAVSRSIGDVDLKRFGVISDPELTGWIPISANEKFLVLASDGIFEKLSTEEVCNVIHAVVSRQDIEAVFDVFEKEPNRVIALPLPGVGPFIPGTKDGSAIKTQRMESVDQLTEIEACYSREHLDFEQWDVGNLSETRDNTGIAQTISEILIELAFQAGSMDNLSVIVVPLRVENG